MRIPFSDYNVRMWIPLKSLNNFNENEQEYNKYLDDIKQYTETKVIDIINFNGDDFIFSKYLFKLINNFDWKFQTLLNDKKDFQEDYKKVKVYLYILWLSLDYILKFNPNPTSVYNWNKPCLLSESFLKITWYTKDEIFDYYKKKWEITSLFYKWKDLEKVTTFLLQFHQSNDWWYLNKKFTLTTKNWKKIELPWNNFKSMFLFDSTLENFSFRTADISSIKVK